MITYKKINENLSKTYRELGYWKETTLLDCWNNTVKQYSSKEYIVDEKGNRLTYQQIDELASNLAGYMQSIGVKCGDFVTLQLPVIQEYVVCIFACIKIGAIIRPIPVTYNKYQVLNFIRTNKIKLFVCPHYFKDVDFNDSINFIKSRLEDNLNVIMVTKDQDNENKFISLNDIYRKNLKEDITVKANSEDVAVILETSGTTGGAKGVMLTHNNIIFSEEYFNKAYDITEKECMFMCSPLNHATGFHHGIISPMLVGAKVVLQEKFYCSMTYELMLKEKCTYSMGATPFIYDLLSFLEKSDEHIIPSLKLYLCGGAPVPSNIVKRAKSKGFTLCEVYGSTESVPHCYVRKEEAIELDGTTSGRAMQGVEIRVVDEQGNDVKVGEIGEEISRGPNVFIGYYNAPNTTNRVLDDDGWYHSGDLAKIDINKNIKIIGRKKDIIVRGGENIDSNLINEYIDGFPNIIEHTIIGKPDDRLGERICLCVVTENNVNINIEDIKNFLKNKNVPKNYWPEYIEFFDELPKTGSGKVKKHILLESIKNKS